MIYIILFFTVAQMILYDEYLMFMLSKEPDFLGKFQTRSSLIHFACIWVASPRLSTPPFACGINSQREATPMQAKWIKLDLVPNQTDKFHVRNDYNDNGI